MNELALLDNAKTPAERRAAIVALEEASRRAGAEQPNLQAHCPLREHWAPGQYAREIFMPAGACIVGKIHRHAHVNIVSKGRAVVFTEHEGKQVIEAGDTWVSKPGTKRTVLVLEDMLWTTVHANPTDSKDSAWLESQLIAPSFDALEAPGDAVKVPV
jgi:quercetin dioxygenase-like cupin family protein